MVIANTTDRIYIKLGSVPTSEMNAVCCYELITDTSATPVSISTVTDRTNNVYITNVLSSNQQLIVKSIYITNVNNEAYSVEVGYYNGSTNKKTFATSLKGGEVLQYTNHSGFSIVGSSSALDLLLIKDSSTDPSLTTGYTSIYSQNIAGKSYPKFGTDDTVQEALYTRPLTLYVGAGTSGGGFGESGTNVGSLGSPGISFTNSYTSIQRSTRSSLVTTTNQTVGRYTTASYTRGNASYVGGFFACCLFGFEKWVAGDRLFVGFCTTGAGALTGNPSALVNMVGFGIDSGDTAITFMHNDATGTAVKDTISSQPALANNNGYRAYIYCKPNDNTVYWRLDNLNTNTKIAEGSVNSELPTNTSTLCFQCVMGNGANIVAGDANIGIIQYYIRL